jgi:hypothetical protein
LRVLPGSVKVALCCPRHSETRIEPLALDAASSVNELCQFIFCVMVVAVVLDSGLLVRKPVSREHCLW